MGPQDSEGSRGQKREVPEGGHLDDDVVLRLINCSSELGQSNLAAGSGLDQGMVGSSTVPEPAAGDAEMMLSKLELDPAVARTLRAAYNRQGVAATDAEIEDMAVMCVSLNACDAAEIYTPP